MSREMTGQEARAFLLEGTRTGKLAVTRSGGGPHVTPTWFTLDGDDQAPPYSYVMVEGSATLSDDLDELRRVATAVGGRYMGADRAGEFGARNAVPGELV